jgi:menaquinone-dependent protoporphyrinogen oxidase
MTTTPETRACAVPVFYATTEGQTRRIAERLAAVLVAQGRDSRAIPLDSPDAHAVDWSVVRGAIVAASIHVQRHQAVASDFATRHAAALSRIPSMFVSVSLSAASVHEKERAAALRIAGELLAAAGWTPAAVLSLGGCLAYTQYGFFTRRLMKRIARKEGAPTDTSRDHEFTNWQRVEECARQLDAMMLERDRQRQSAA